MVIKKSGEAEALRRLRRRLTFAFPVIRVAGCDANVNVHEFGAKLALPNESAECPTHPMLLPCNIKAVGVVPRTRPISVFPDRQVRGVRDQVQIYIPQLFNAPLF